MLTAEMPTGIWASGHEKAEELFQKLNRVKDRFKDWVALGSVDLEEMIEKHCKDPEDWEANFRNSKLKRQGRLPVAEGIDWLHIRKF